MATVLIVEDTADLRDAFLEIVTDAGYNAVGAENGQCALDVLESLEEPPALVLLDIMMPVMDGWQFLQRLRSMNRVPELPVVIVSAVPTPRLACLTSASSCPSRSVQRLCWRWSASSVARRRERR
jgi:CheY-like chemotaxis protein